MSEKRVKAWAVVNQNGKIQNEYRRLWIHRTKKEAVALSSTTLKERVVPVTIIVEEK